MTGIIVLDKPKGITSFGVVAAVKRITGEKKCGHTGTLDPMATGVMPVLLGGATRFCELLPSHDKAYRAKILLGTVTDTLDITGTVLKTSEVNVKQEQFKNALARFTGEIEQLPPMYSAVSVDGKRLYELARKGIEVERKARRVSVYSADLISADEEKGEYEIAVACSAGTYIRTLAADIGEVLGCGAVLTQLRRTAANGFTAEDAVTPELLSLLSDFSGVLISVDKALAAYSAVTVTAAQAVRFKNGGELDRGRISCECEGGLIRVYSPQNEFLGLGEITDTQLKVKRVYNG